MTTTITRCLRCHRPFARRRAGHVFCSPDCRHRGPRRATDPEPPDDRVLARLFDDRPDGQPVADDDWHPRGPPWADPDAIDTVGQRRGWFRTLVEEGKL